jgi:hypothetical protein
MGLTVIILLGNNLEDGVILASNDYPRIVGDDQVCYQLHILNFVPRRRLEIQTTPPHAHPVQIAAHEKWWR